MPMRPAENHHVLDLDVGTPRELHNLAHSVLPRNDIDDVAFGELLAAAWDDGLPAPRNGDGPVTQRRVVLLGGTGVGADQRRSGLEPEDDERELAARKIDVLGSGGMPQEVDDLAGGDLLGIKEVVDAHVDEDLLVVGLEILVVVDTGDGLLGAELLGEHGGDDVDVLLVVDGDEEVAATHRSPAQGSEGGGIALDGDDVGQTAHLREELLVAVDDGDVVAVAAQHPGQMAAHLARTRYHDFHGAAWIQARRSPAGSERTRFCNLSYKCIHLSAKAKISAAKNPILCQRGR